MANTYRGRRIAQSAAGMFVMPSVKGEMPYVAVRPHVRLVSLTGHILLWNTAWLYQCASKSYVGKACVHATSFLHGMHFPSASKAS